MLDRIADGRTDLVFDFLAAGHPVDSKDANGVSLYQWCEYYGDVSAIKFLLSKGASLSPRSENHGLNGAAFHGHWRLCQFLLEQGADVNFADAETCETALHSAICKVYRPMHNHMIRVLLAAGANPNAVTKPGVETGCFMRDCRTKGETPLHRAAAFGNDETIQLLLDAGAKVDVKDANGDTPLSWASWYLRPPYILAKLCHRNYHIHPESVAESIREHHTSGGGMEGAMQGKPHM